MQAAFVDIGQNKNTFIHANEIMPKVDITKNEKIEVKDIKELAKIGMPLIVQVKRGDTKQKGARVSTHLNIPGRFVVLMPNVDIITVSQKIEMADERERLINIMKEIVPKNFGIIVRTSAKGKSINELKQDLDHLINIWENIQLKIKNQNNVPMLLYESDSILKKILIDMIDKKLNNIIVEDESLCSEVKQIIEGFNLQNKPKVIIENNIIEKYNITKQLEKINKHKVWLKCGGFIVIDKTEALISIDVNSGKYTGKNEVDKTIYTINKEATEEIARQLRVRDLSGIIIIDYIDMKEQSDKQKIVELLKDRLKFDRSKTQVYDFTKLNLLEMTRKHMFSNKE